MSSNMPSREDLAEVAFLYYIRNMNQQDIATYLGVSRPVVSRMLSAAREQGVVSFSIDFPLQRRADLESGILQAWPRTKLKNVIVVEGAPDSFSASSVHSSLSPGFLGVAQAGASWLEKQVKPGVQIGLSWGVPLKQLSTLHDLIAELMPQSSSYREKSVLRESSPATNWFESSVKNLERATST